MIENSKEIQNFHTEKETSVNEEKTEPELPPVVGIQKQFYKLLKRERKEKRKKIFSKIEFI
jgi:hypothetical protein